MPSSNKELVIFAIIVLALTNSIVSGSTLTSKNAKDFKAARVYIFFWLWINNLIFVGLLCAYLDSRKYIVPYDIIFLAPITFFIWGIFLICAICLHFDNIDDGPFALIIEVNAVAGLICIGIMGLVFVLLCIKKCISGVSVSPIEVNVNHVVYAVPDVVKVIIP